MDRNHYLKALELANLIWRKTTELRCKQVKDVRFGSMLSILRFVNAKKEDVEESATEEHAAAIVPEIYEIILFGSVAAGAENPSDIDLMIIDNGHFSDFFPCNTDKYHTEDAYQDLGDNLAWLMSGWFDVSEEQVHTILGDTEVDLHVLPLRFLKSENARAVIAAKHKDPNFFRNVFGTALRFNRVTNEFEPFTLEYLEDHYRCDLRDLR